jgi:hypothetical protein
VDVDIEAPIAFGTISSEKVIKQKKINAHLDDKGSHVGQDEYEGEPPHWKQDVMSTVDFPGKATKKSIIRGNEETGLSRVNTCS